MKKYLAIIFIGCLLVSCVDKLDKLPIIGELDSNFYQDEGDAYAALTAAYDPLQYNYTTSVYHFRWFFGDFASDDAIKGGTGLTDQPQLEEISTFFATSNNIHVNADWTAKYIGIYRANLVLEKVPEIPANPPTLPRRTQPRHLHTSRGRGRVCDRCCRKRTDTRLSQKPSV